MKKKNNKSSFGSDLFEILTDPNEPLINYRGIKYSSKNDIIRYKNQHYVNNYMKWINVQAFKLYYDKKVYVQCLYIKNANAINKREILLFSQSFRTNFGTVLPFLIDLSNYLKINIITYQYNNKDKEIMNNLDINVVYNYLYKLEFVRSIILMGLSLGNKINMNIYLSKANLYPKAKIKAMILISPTWVYNLADIKNLKNSNKLKAENDKFLKNINLYNIPVFIIHGKKDTTVKYFLSMSYSQQIKKKSEWFPKNGTHLDIINAHRTKLLMRVKQFLIENDLLKKVENDPYLLNKIKLKEISENDINFEDRKTTTFNNPANKKLMQKTDEEYYGYYNSNDIMGGKKSSTEKKPEEKEDGLYTVCQPKIKNENDITINQISQGKNININNQSLDVTLGGNNENDITINENTIDYGNDTLNRLDVSFLPGDIVPSVINRTNTTIMKNNEEDVSFM